MRIFIDMMQKIFKIILWGTLIVLCLAVYLDRTYTFLNKVLFSIIPITIIFYKILYTKFLKFTVEESDRIRFFVDSVNKDYEELKETGEEKESGKDSNE